MSSVPPHFRALLIGLAALAMGFAAHAQTNLLGGGKQQHGTSAASASTPAQISVYAEVSQKLQTGRYAEAQAQAERYIQGNPRDPQMRYLLGLTQRARNKPDDAAETFSRLTNEYPELPEPHNALATLYAARGDYEQARLSLERAIRARPDYATALENLGDLQLRLAQQAYCSALKSDARNDKLRARVQTLGMQCPTINAPASQRPLPTTPTP